MTARPWRVFGASVQGTSHVGSGTPCQDAHAYRVLPDGAVLIAVADGAGSAARAEEGARRAVDAAVASLGAALDASPRTGAEWYGAMLGAFRDARRALDEAATAAGAPLRDFSATLTCAVATDDRLVVGQIGDGVAVAADGDERLFTTIRPRRGEYANEAFFLTVPQPLRHVDVAAYPGPIEAVAVTTDGLLRLAVNLPSYEPHAPFFRPLLGFATEVEGADEGAVQLAALLASERVSARTDDDKTLVLAVRVPPTSAGTAER